MGAFMKGQTIVRTKERLLVVSAKDATDAKVLDTATPGSEWLSGDETYGIKIAKRSCVDITDGMDMDFSTVVYNNRFSGPRQMKEQVCYWLLKCKGGRKAGL